MPLPPDSRILSYIARNPGISSALVANHIKLSRQKTAARLTRLVSEGKIARTGSTKNARYFPPRKGAAPQPLSVRLIKSLHRLAEDRVFDEIDLRLSLKKKLPENVYRIVYYAFTEMLNNAIDHSRAKNAEIVMVLGAGKLSFTIRDRGIGAFANMRQKFKLASEFEALEHLIKGRQTTFPEQHTGQGVFFTSRVADRFTLRSHKLEFTVDNRLGDIFVGERTKHQGTSVSFEILQRSRKLLKAVFDKYSNAEFEFDRADFRVKLTADHELLSRSQAKRITAGLEIYKKIIFDFAAVKEIGQGFTDEIFRVFQNRNPHMEITFCNSNEAVSGMILRAIKDKQE